MTESSEKVQHLKPMTALALFRELIASIIQPRTPLRSHADNLLVRRRVRPDDIKVIIRIGRRILVPQSIDNIRQSIVFPANQDIAGSIVAFHGIRNAVRVITVAVRVDCEAKIFSERLYSLVWAGAFAAWVGVLVLVDVNVCECGDTTHFSSASGPGCSLCRSRMTSRIRFAGIEIVVRPGRSGHCHRRRVSRHGGSDRLLTRREPARRLRVRGGTG